MKNTCKACGAPREPSAKFCQECGSSLASVPAADDREAPAERRQITVMFSDVVGSTALAESLEPEDVRDVMRAYQAQCREIIHEFGGYVAQYLGDGVVAYFGYPRAREEASRSAVHAGLGIISAMRSLQVGGSQKSLEVRIGIHTGMVVVGGRGGFGPEGESQAFGGAPNIAARVESAAASGTVVLSGSTYKLVSKYFTFFDLGSLPMKGISDPVQLFQVLEETDAGTRFDVAVRDGLVPLVGREEHLATLEAGWQKAKARAGRIVLVTGGAGIGKTRLLRALRERIAGDAHAIVDCSCSPNHQNSALYPLLEYMQRFFGFQTGDSAETRLAKLSDGLLPFTGRTAETVSLFAALLSLPHPEGAPPLVVSPQSGKQRTLDALVAWLLDAADRQPVHFELEDLHWADPSTLELVDLLIGQSSQAAINLLMTSREKSFVSRWEAQPHVSHIEIARLPPQGIEQLIERVAGRQALDHEVAQQIVAKADGVPLFAEELTKMVVEAGGAAGDGAIQLTIPATLQDSLMARLDQLPAALGVAQLGATLGREFPHALIRAVSTMDEAALQSGLDSLVEAGLLMSHELGHGTQYTFKHALIQDAAYGSLVRSRRQQLHLRTSEVLERGFMQLVETEPEIVAHHFGEAGLGERAIPYWQRAGQRALSQSAYVEALHHFSRALELNEELNDSHDRDEWELGVRSSLGLALIATQGYGSEGVERNYSRAEKLCQRLGDVPQLFPSLYGLWTYHMLRGHRDSTFELADRLGQIAARPEQAYIAKSTQGITRYWSGDFAACEAILHEAVELYDPSYHELLDPILGDDAALLAHLYRPWCLVDLGLPDEARDALASLPHPSTGSPSPYVQVTALVFEMVTHLNVLDNERAQAVSEHVIALATEHQFPFFLAAGTCARGSTSIRRGSVEKGISEIADGLAMFELTGTEASRAFWLARMAEGFLAAGKAADGLAIVDEAIESRETSLARFNVIELQQLRGDLLLLEPDDSTEAEGCFRNALELAQSQGAPRLGLAAALRFARMLRKQGRNDEARDVLQIAIDRMPKQNSPPLASAQEMLGELS